MACEASVSVRFRSKERPRKGNFGFHRARNETKPKSSSPPPPRSFNCAICRVVFDSRSSFFVLKPQQKRLLRRLGLKCSKALPRLKTYRERQSCSQGIGIDFLISSVKLYSYQNHSQRSSRDHFPVLVYHDFLFVPFPICRFHHRHHKKKCSLLYEKLGKDLAP